MTEEKQGGTTPEPEAIASATDQASEDTVAAVAVADEPATTTDDAAATTETESPPAAETRRVPHPSLPRRKPGQGLAVSPVSGWYAATGPGSRRW